MIEQLNETSSELIMVDIEVKQLAIDNQIGIELKAVID